MKKQVFGYLHTHWDIEWYRDIEDFNLRFLDVFDIVLDELKNNRAPFFYLDGQCMALLEYLKYRPNKKEEIKELIKQNKLAIGPFLVSADSYLINFQSMLKNIKYGLEISKEFEQKDFIGYMSDIFGVSNSIFEALKLNNIKNAMIWRGVNPKKIKNNCNFIKNGINTTWLIQGYFNDFFHQETPNIKGIKNYLDKISKYSKDALLLPIGADHLGMLKNANEKIKFVNSKLDNYEIILTNPFEYFKKTNFINSTNEKEFLDNSNTFILQGVYSARIVQKIKNNEIQNELSRIIEPFNYFLNEKFQPNIDELYKTLIKNHAHDGIYGCSIDSVHRTINSRQEKIKNSINAIKKRFIGNFKKAQEIKGNSTNKIGLFNLSNIKNLKTIQVDLPYKLKNSQIIKTKKSFSDDLFYDIYKIPVTEDITNIYTQLIEITNNNCYEFSVVNIKKAKKKTIVSSNGIENEKIKLEIIDKNIIIINKKSLETFELKITDIKDIGDSYNFGPVIDDEYEIAEIKTARVITNGKLRCTLRVCTSFFNVDITLDKKSKLLKFKIKWLNLISDKLWQVRFNFDNYVNEVYSEDMNLLILSAGTRNKVVQYFKKECGEKDKIIATDCSNLAPAVYDADKFYLVPRINHPDYLNIILDICRKESITGVLSLIDPELSLISKHREEFAAVSVKAYEALTGKKAAPVANNPFVDTKNTEVLKAYNLGLTTGTSASTFEPNALLNREQAATMLTRTYKKATIDGWTIAEDSKYPLEYTKSNTFADDKDISSWAKDSVYFMNANGIINGVGDNKFAPKNTTSAEEAVGYANATREQAIIIATRMVKNLK